MEDRARHQRQERRKSLVLASVVASVVASDPTWQELTHWLFISGRRLRLDRVKGQHRECTDEAKESSGSSCDITIVRCHVNRRSSSDLFVNRSKGSSRSQYADDKRRNKARQIPHGRLVGCIERQVDPVPEEDERYDSRRWRESCRGSHPVRPRPYSYFIRYTKLFCSI